MGHIGYTPQFKKKFKLEGKTKKEISKLLKQAELIQRAGLFQLCTRMLDANAAKMITKT